MSPEDTKVFMAYATEKDNKKHISSHHSFMSAERMLNSIAYRNDFDEDVLKSMRLVRCAPEKTFSPQVLKSLTFAASEETPPTPPDPPSVRVIKQ